MESPWLMRFKSASVASVRLFCFHCAGGSASEFRTWSTHLPGMIEVVAVQLPGREGRLNEAFIASMEDLVGSVVDAIAPLLDKPCVVFGHSFGAICGFEVIREIGRRGLRQPFLFIPAGRQGPDVKEKKAPISSLPRRAFIEALRKDYGDHIGHVLDNVELQDVFIPQIHADFTLCEAYRPRDERRVDCPILAFAGESEKDLETEELNAWALHTSGSFRSRRFPGDHFFIRQSQAPVIAAITQEICSLRQIRIAESRPVLG